MKTRGKILVVATLLLAVVVLAGSYLHSHPIAVLQPAGQVGTKERNLMIFTASISLIVVVPVFVMLGMFAWRYREGNPRGRYDPKFEGNGRLEAVWWAIPAIFITIIGVITWNSSYALDPFKPLQGNKPLHIQVVALDWKWLFIYPEQGVASVNEAAIPVGTPVDFEITSDTVMTSFWAPQLGGQMYAMPGMNTQENLMAAKTGDFRGVAANISGSGFAGMSFTVKSQSQSDFKAWVGAAQHSGSKLTDFTYMNLARPSSNNKAAYYAAVQPDLYDTIIMKYMMPTDGGDSVDAVGVSF